MHYLLCRISNVDIYRNKGYLWSDRCLLPLFAFTLPVCFILGYSAIRRIGGLSLNCSVPVSVLRRTICIVDNQSWRLNSSWVSLQGRVQMPGVLPSCPVFSGFPLIPSAVRPRGQWQNSGRWWLSCRQIEIGLRWHGCAGCALCWNFLSPGRTLKWDRILLW